jgi:hypothetical protein
MWRKALGADGKRIIDIRVTENHGEAGSSRPTLRRLPRSREGRWSYRLRYICLPDESEGGDDG